MKKLIVFILLMLSFFFLGCLEQNTNGLEEKKQVSSDDISKILGDNDSVEEVRTAIIEALDEVNNTNSSGGK